MSETEPRLQRPLPEAILDIRRLLLTPNPAPRYPRAAGDDADRVRNRKRLIRVHARSRSTP